MKTLLILLLVAAVAAGVYFKFIRESAAYTTYKNFASALANLRAVDHPHAAAAKQLSDPIM